MTGSSMSHTLLSTISCCVFLISVSARPDGGVPRKVRRHLTHAAYAVEVLSATPQAPSRHGAPGCAHLGSTATTGTHGVWSAGRANSKPSRTVRAACPARNARPPPREPRLANASRNTTGQPQTEVASTVQKALTATRKAACWNQSRSSAIFGVRTTAQCRYCLAR